MPFTSKSKNIKIKMKKLCMEEEHKLSLKKKG